MPRVRDREVHNNGRVKTMDVITFRVRAFLAMLVSVVVIGTLGFVVVEGLNLADALYFSIVTITTVGFGDIHPTTLAGKALTVLLIVLGVGSFMGLVANTTDRLLHQRERRRRLEKLNMVIGVFFSEVGTGLLAYCSDHDPRLGTIRKDLIVTGDWSEGEFLRVSDRLRNYEYRMNVEKVDLGRLRRYLVEKRGFLLRLLENPTLLEHEAFTDLLLAVFHLTEELIHRETLGDLPETDRDHLGGDFKRMYTLLVHQWLDYMRYLKGSYPYLFSLAMRTNPFDREATPIIG